VKKLVILLAILGVIYFLITQVDLMHYSDIDVVKSMINDVGIWGPIVFIGIYIIATVLFLPGAPLTIGSGLIFGTLYGGLYTVIGATIGASLAFMISRYFGEEFVERILKGKFKKIYEYDEKIKKNGLLVMFFLRLVPLVPFNVLNYAMGLTKMKRRDYMIATFFGIMPGTFIYANIGSASTNVGSSNFILAIALFGMLFLILPAYKYFKKKSKKAESFI